VRLYLFKNFCRFEVKIVTDH